MQRHNLHIDNDPRQRERLNVFSQIGLDEDRVRYVIRDKMDG